MVKGIKIYTTPTCPYCKMAKKYLKGKGLTFKEVDVASNLEARREMIKISGQMGVPVITLGNKVIVGFDRPRLEKVLGAL